MKTGDAAVRITGLSGIGKTRIVQALFEQEVGNTPELPPSQARYADLGQPHTTSPIQMLDALLQFGEPVVLVADNCPPETHQALARRLAEVRSEVRLVTVEYDVRSDQSEETDVVKIEAVGSDIVESLLRRRRPDLSSSDARRLAVLAQGNARLGLALAQAAPKTDSLSTFDDTVLFDRLFRQRNTPDPALKESAEVLSLVYSFDVEGDDELTVLGSLIGKPRKKLRRHTATLRNRGLAQDRGKWCAISPHALANKLARDALENIYWRDVADTFADKPRLRQSFAKRLSYLRNVKEARQIVRYWMKPDRPLEDPTADMKLVRSVSHLVSDDLLKFVEKRIKTGDQPDQRLSQIDDLISITDLVARDENLFSRVCDILKDLALRPNPMRELIGKDLASEAIDNLFGLFGVNSSGTSAQTAVRISVAEKALNSSDQRVVDLGIKMLSSALETNKVILRTVNFDEDAQPSARRRELRDDEIVDWFGAWIRLAVDVANSDNQAAERESRTALVNRMFGIWHRCISVAESAYRNHS